MHGIRQTASRRGRAGNVRTAALCLGICTAGAWGQTPEFRGLWADAFHPAFRTYAELDELVQRAVEGRYNAIIAEVMAYQDRTGGGHGAYWNSAILPKASDIQAGLDPLGYLCSAAHAYGIEVHAWLVAFRVCNDGDWPPSGNSRVQASWLMVPRAQMGTIAGVGGHCVLDPGSPDVQDYLMSIVRELVTNYPIDGINWDYIRYTQTDAGYPADTSYANSSLKRFQRIYNRGDVPSASDSQWSDFRRRTITELIRRCRAEIPSIRTNPRQPLRHSADLICFGSAPSSCSGFTSTSAYSLFQDWRTWMEYGYLDAGIPMNYKQEHCASEAAMYRGWVDRILSCWRYNRHVFCGQGNYQNGFDGSVAQLLYCRNAGANGMASYSYWSTRSTETICDSNEVTFHDTAWYAHVAANVFTAPAAPPTMPWRNPTTATEGTVWGRVKDFSTGLPVDDATVTLTGRPAVRTDANGYYTITLVPATAGGTNHSMTVTRTGLPSASHPAARVLAGDVVRYDFALGAPAPMIVLNPPSIDRQIDQGQSLPPESFTVAAAAGRAPLNYYLTTHATWIGVSPTMGVSEGEADPIQVTFNVSGLSPGHHTAQVLVTDAAALNSPAAFSINLTVLVPPKPGDFDRDNDVDQEDFGRMQNCLTGVSNPQNDPACQQAKLEGNDDDVDAGDMARFLGCMSGPEIPSDPDCLNR